MKICGTERRPLRAIISARASGRSSTLIVSNSTPFRSSNPWARAQYGHQSVKYITTLGRAAMTGSSGLRQREVLGAPCADPLTQVECLGESLLRELPDSCGSQRAGVVVDHDNFLFLLFQRVTRLQNLLSRHLLGTGHVTIRIFFGRAQVNDRSALVHQPHEVLRRYGGEVLVPVAQLVDGDQYGGEAQASGIPRVMGDVFEKTVHGCRSDKGRALK